MTRSPLFNFILGSAFGFALAATFVAVRGRQALAAPPDPPQQECASIEMDGKQFPISQKTWDVARENLRAARATIDRLNAELAEAKANPAAQMLAQTGHVMNEEQCRAWMGILNVPRDLAQAQAANFATVLYESGRASIHVSLLPLPGAPRVALSPNSQLAPRWIIPGKIQPQMVGETRKALYYYFDAQSSQWQGPFAPERIAQ